MKHVQNNFISLIKNLIVVPLRPLNLEGGKNSQLVRSK